MPVATVGGSYSRHILEVLTPGSGISRYKEGCGTPRRLLQVRLRRPYADSVLHILYRVDAVSVPHMLYGVQGSKYSITADDVQPVIVQSACAIR
eukprot:3112553-Rhodomonas_salina.12